MIETEMFININNNNYNIWYTYTVECLAQTSLRFPSQLRALAAFKQQQKERLQILDGEKARTIIITISLYNTLQKDIQDCLEVSYNTGFTSVVKILSHSILRKTMIVVQDNKSKPSLKHCNQCLP